MFKKLGTWFGRRSIRDQDREQRTKYILDLTAVMQDVDRKLIASELHDKTVREQLDVLIRKMDRLDLVRDAMNRVCEMAMVAAGRPSEALQFRQVAGAVERDSWVDRQPDEPQKWPPDNSVELISRG